MNTNELRFAIESSFTKCAQCDSKVDEWPDADASEPGHPVIYVPQLRAFAGVCPAGHMNEWTEARAKAGETAPEDVTVRTCGRFISQENCTHARKGERYIPEGQQVVTADGPIQGPSKIWMCGFCGRRGLLTTKKSKIILP